MRTGKAEENWSSTVLSSVEISTLGYYCILTLRMDPRIRVCKYVSMPRLQMYLLVSIGLVLGSQSCFGDKY